VRILLVGNPDPVHVGAHLANAARSHGLSVDLISSEDASQGSPVLRKLSWHLRGHRPLHLNQFSDSLVMRCRSEKPSAVITTGIAPVSAEALRQLASLGIRTMNYLTDDPFNAQHRAPWFLRALPQYQFVFSTRRANLEELRDTGAGQVCYLPFAYAPEVHFPEECDSSIADSSPDVLFAGGADRDRIPYIRALVQAGLKLLLYGGYWDRHPDCAPFWKGMASPAVLRRATASAKTTLCLVRRMNRDGSCMRTFEAPAMGTCMLTEDTEEHREIFGPEGEAVCYFGSIEELVKKAQWLSREHGTRRRLAERANRVIVDGRNTYRDRLVEMLTVVGLAA